MIKSLIILSIFLLSACGAAMPAFPDSPGGAIEPCPELKTVPEDTIKNSVLMKTINENYTAYHQCAAKVDTWVEWYTAQKLIYEKPKD